MPFERINLQSFGELNSDERSRAFSMSVDKTVAALRAGKSVVLPTETVYGLAVRAADEAAVQRLLELKGRQEGHPMALAISGVRELADFVPEMSDLASRLARRCWPGPVSLVFDAKQPGSVFYDLPEFVQNATSKGNTVSFRVPNHAFTLAVLADLSEPIILTSANRSGQPEAVGCDDIAAQLGSGLDLIVDDGPLAHSQPSTVLKVDGNQYSVLRAGPIREETLKRLSARMILFVCTGNTCRSPMAERICEKLIADRIGCRMIELEQHGIVVLSAGLAAGFDMPASRNAVAVMKNRNLDLSDHHSLQLSETHVRFADLIYTMTRGHREAILSQWPEADTRLSVLRLDGGDISDPIGGSVEVYEACARQLESEIAKRLDQIGLKQGT